MIVFISCLILVSRCLLWYFLRHMTVGANILTWKKKVNSHYNYHCLNIQESVGNAILRDFLLLPIESCLFMKQSKNNSLHFKSLTGRRQCQYLRKIKQKLISLILFSLLYLMFFFTNLPRLGIHWRNGWCSLSLYHFTSNVIYFIFKSVHLKYAFQTKSIF